MTTPPFELYLIRHGIAAERADSGGDQARPLTADGISRLRAEAAGLEALEVKWDLILSSPLVRARQTAEVLGEVMHDASSLVTAALAPGASPEATIAEVDKHDDRARVALIGHEPNMGELAARLLGSREPIVFKKGAVCRIDFLHRPLAAGAGALRWFATPKMLRLIAKR